MSSLQEHETFDITPVTPNPFESRSITTKSGLYDLDDDLFDGYHDLPTNMEEDADSSSDSDDDLDRGLAPETREQLERIYNMIMESKQNPHSNCIESKVTQFESKLIDRPQVIEEEESSEDSQSTIDSSPIKQQQQQEEYFYDNEDSDSDLEETDTYEYIKSTLKKVSSIKPKPTIIKKVTRKVTRKPSRRQPRKNQVQIPNIPPEPKPKSLIDIQLEFQELLKTCKVPRTYRGGRLPITHYITTSIYLPKEATCQICSTRCSVLHQMSPIKITSVDKAFEFISPDDPVNIICQKCYSNWNPSIVKHGEALKLHPNDEESDEYFLDDNIKAFFGGSNTFSTIIHVHI